MVWIKYTHIEQTSLLKMPLNIALLVESSVFSTVTLFLYGRFMLLRVEKKLKGFFAGVLSQTYILSSNS